MEETLFITGVTDYLLALLGYLLSFLLFQKKEASRIVLAAGYFLSASAAASAGVYHQFYEVQGSGDLLWQGSMIVFALSNFALLVGTILLFYEKTLCWILLSLATIKTIVFGIYYSQHPMEFLPSLVDAFNSFLAIFILALAKRAYRIVAGVMICFLGAFLWVQGVEISPTWDRNALFHLIQIVGIFVLYLGFKRKQAL